MKTRKSLTPVALVYRLVGSMAALLLANGTLTASTEEIPAPAVTLQQLMAIVITEASNQIWNAALLEPAAGADKPSPTEEQWATLRSAATTLLVTPTLMLHRSLAVAPPDAEAVEGSLSPAAIAELRGKQWALWAAQVSILQQSAVAALNAIEARDYEATLQAGDTLYGVCDSCHTLFWYPEGQ
jgi:hypothetical protein